MGLDYKAAGVDIEAGNELVQRIKPHAKKTHGSGVLTGLGSFGALFELPHQGFSNPVLVSSTDGVGTKLKLALELEQYQGVGIDLVAMCVNDIIVMGATPLFFLDYYATGVLDVDVAEQVIASIAAGCQQGALSLIGGETAEMPGIYQGKDYDLAGFCVGIVDKPNIIDGSKVETGNVLIGLASSGPHANGFSLIRKILEKNQVDLQSKINGQTLGEQLLAPTKIYVKSLLALQQAVPVHAMAHITGGGLTENLPRVLPDNMGAKINVNSWPRPELFDFLQEHGQINNAEMLKTFNCGIGMIVCVAADQEKVALECLRAEGETAWVIGHVEPRSTDHHVVQYCD